MASGIEYSELIGPADRFQVSVVNSTSDTVSIRQLVEGRLDELLEERGAILFRGFAIESDEDFSSLVEAIGKEQLSYSERSTVRSNVSGAVYTSTEYPAHKAISSHSENSFQRVVPGKIFFYANMAPTVGGETPIASNSEILDALDPVIADELRSRGVMYHRNFDGGFDLSWKEAFQATSRAEVEAYCSKNSIEYRWKRDDSLQTRQVRPAIRRSSRTGKELWYNQLHLFHSSNMMPEMRSAILDELGPDGLPRNATFGDGGEIPDDLVEAVRDAIRSCEVLFPWETGDVLLADNLLVSHGRRPFTGDRKIRVALVDPKDLGTDD